MDNNTLFNCTTGWLEPDWNEFTHIELGGCRPSEDGINGGFDRYEAAFFTVYARDQEGYAEAITDINGTFDDAMAVAERLTELSGLELEVVC
jgi:hypothetical protein